MSERHLGKHTDAARVLGIEPCTIRKMTLQGRIPYIKIGRAVRYDLSEILEFFKNKTRSENVNDDNRPTES